MKRTVATMLLGVLLLTLLPTAALATPAAATPLDEVAITGQVAFMDVPSNQDYGGSGDWWEYHTSQSSRGIAGITATGDTSNIDYTIEVVKDYSATLGNGSNAFCWVTTDVPTIVGSWSSWAAAKDNDHVRSDCVKHTATALLLAGYSQYQTTAKLTYKQLKNGEWPKDGSAPKISLPNFQNNKNEKKNWVTASANKRSVIGMLRIAFGDEKLVIPDSNMASLTAGSYVCSDSDRDASAALQLGTILFWCNAVGATEADLKGTGITEYVNYLYQVLKMLDTGAMQQNVLEGSLKSLGDFPEKGTFYAKARWSSQYYTLKYRQDGTPPAMDKYVTMSEADSAPVNGNDPDASYTSEIQKAYIQSCFRIVDQQPGDVIPSSPIETGLTVDMPIDVQVAPEALRTYLTAESSGELSDLVGKMAYFQYKLQATMALASGMLAPNPNDDTGTAVTQEEIDTFYSVAYGAGLNDINNLIVASVEQPTSAHMGVNVSPQKYYYLVLAYQEFAAYATQLLDELGPILTMDNTSFTSQGESLKALQSMFEVVTWADDDALWHYWSWENTNLQNPDNDFRSLKALYDYLASVNAFDGIQSYDPDAMESAFAYFFNTEQGFQLSEQMQMGVTASATFLPMRSSVYDPYTFDETTTTDWLVNFHAKFGYNRKALYRDTTVDAAVNFHRTKSKGNLAVCTLEDMLNADQDIVLYIDDNLYNVDKLAEMTDKAFSRLDNVDSASANTSVVGKLWESAKGSWEINMENVAKTAEVVTYSSEVKNGGIISTVFTSWDEFFMPLETAKEELSPDTAWDEETQSMIETSGYTYGPMMPYAVLSGVYQDASLFRSLNTTLSGSHPVFVSSPTVPYLPEASKKERNEIFNYLLLKNLDSQMTVDYATNLDLTSPIYMDVYGNIVTESGVVIVPAAANSTLYSSTYTPYNTAFYSTYGDDFLLPYDEKAEELNGILMDFLTPVDGTWELASVKVAGGSVDLARLSTADKDSLAAITEVFAYDIGTPTFCESTLWEVIITEVLRGAPIECINKDFEGLNTSSRITRSGLMVANKLDELVEALSSEGANATLSIPNPAYIDGLEYVVFFAFKILILLTLVIWMATIYVDAVGGGINLRTGGKCIGAILLTLSLIVGVPAIFELSYYESNKALLQEETELLMMLNLEKSESGNEIGITKVTEPDSNTKLYLRLADVEIPWWDLLPKIMVSSMDKNLEKLYAEYEEAHPIANSPEVTVKNGTVYVSTDQLFNSSTVSFSTVTKQLYQQAAGDTPASYYTPYYVFLNQIIAKTNMYAEQESYYAYSTKIQKGGRLKTLGFIQPYFNSEEFMTEGMDYFGLYTLYDVTAPAQYLEVTYDDTTLNSIRNSQWCQMDLSEDAKIARIEKLNTFAQKWVGEHKNMIGKVTDETFLKTMALACALEHNRLFNTMRADNLEIRELSNEDLLRLSIGDKDQVMRNSTMSFARYVYTVGGTPGVYAAAILILVNFLGSWIKPLVTLIVFIITCISIFVFKLILRRNNKSVYGYITTILLMCGVNLLGALFLKLTMYIPATGLSPTVCILVQIVVQILYIWVLVRIVKIALKDWRNVGFQRYSSEVNTIVHHKEHSVDVDTSPSSDGWDYYNRLVERQRRRHRSL